MESLLRIGGEVARRAALIGAPESSLPTYGQSDNFTRPHIEVDNRGHHRVVVERGEELDRVTTTDLDELRYRVFEGVTFGLACSSELAHHDESKDGRRLIFRRQEELLGKLSKGSAARETERHQRILSDCHFDQTAAMRGQLPSGQ